VQSKKRPLAVLLDQSKHGVGRERDIVDEVYIVVFVVGGGRRTLAHDVPEPQQRCSRAHDRKAEKMFGLEMIEQCAHGFERHCLLLAFLCRNFQFS